MNKNFTLANNKESRKILALSTFALIFILFCLATPIAPLYSYNQNTYFFHGLSQSGYGALDLDWLSTTKDTFPLFTALVKGTYLFLPEWFFNFYYLLIKLVFISSIYFVIKRFFNFSYSQFLITSIILIVINSIAFEYHSFDKIGLALGRVFTNGFAQQYILGLTFQPSVFGTFLLSGITLFLYNKKKYAVISCAIAGLMHTSYLLHGLIIVFAFSFSNSRLNLKDIFLFLALVSPAILYTGYFFILNDSPHNDLARELLVNYVIPEHAKLKYFFSFNELIQILIMIFGLILIRNSKFYFNFLLLISIPLALTLLQLLLDSNFLALVFPWRITIVLIPLLTSIIIAKIVAELTRHTKIQLILCLFLLPTLFITIYASVSIKNKRILYLKETTEAKIGAHVKTLNLREQVLTPTSFHEFRIDTGTPTFVDDKNHPYDADSIIEWHKRLMLADRFYKNPTCESLEDITNEYMLNYLVLLKERKLSCPNLNLIICSQNYCLHKRTPIH